MNKIIGAIVKVYEPLLDDEKSIPICFKAKKDSIPSELLLQTESPRPLAGNMIKVSIPGYKSLRCYCFAIVDDSPAEIDEIYELNRKKPPLCNMKGLKDKIEYYVPLDNVHIGTLGLLTIQQDQFDLIFRKFKSEKRSSEGASSSIAKHQKTSTTKSSDTRSQPANNKTQLKQRSSLLSTVIETISTDSPRTRSQPARTPLSFTDSSEASDHPTSAQHTYHVVFKRPMPEKVNEGASTSSAKQQKTRFEVLVDALNRPTTTSSTQRGVITTTTIIPEKDETFDNGHIKYLEGKLPVYLKDYNLAMDELRDELVPENIMRKLVKYCFPVHWINGVTLTGRSSNNRVSLIMDVWSFQDPLKKHRDGLPKKGLGEMRLKALIEHVFRKANKIEYGEAEEQNLKRILIAAISNKRSAIERRKHFI